MGCAPRTQTVPATPEGEEACLVGQLLDRFSQKLPWGIKYALLQQVSQDLPMLAALRMTSLWVIYLTEEKQKQLADFLSCQKGNGGGNSLSATVALGRFALSPNSASPFELRMQWLTYTMLWVKCHSNQKCLHVMADPEGAKLFFQILAY